MDKLPKLCTSDGHSYYCFIQVKDTLFPSIPKSTVKNWLRDLKIKLTSCSEEERIFFKKASPHLTGAFGKLSSDDLERLCEYSKSKKCLLVTPFTSPTTASSTPLTTASSSSMSTSLPVASTIKVLADFNAPRSGLNSQNDNSYTTCLDREVVIIEGESESIDHALEFSDITTEQSMGINRKLPSTESEQMLENSIALTGSKGTLSLPLTPTQVETDFVAVEPNDHDVIHSTPPSKGGNPRIRYSLKDEHVTPALREELSNFKRFYSVGINSRRGGIQLTHVTFAKVKERALCFLGFVRRTKPATELSLDLANDLDLVEGFVSYLKEGRELAPGTLKVTLSAIINILKYVNQDVPDFLNLPIMTSIRNMQSQFSAEESFTRKRKREGFYTCTKERDLLFSNILDVLRQLREKFQNSSGLLSSRFLHDFTFLSLYIRASPGRAKEFRTLTLIDNSCSEQAFCTERFENINALVFEPDGSVILIECDFKTVKNMGPSRIDLTDDEWLVYYLKMYVNQHRQGLLLGKDHGYVFVNRNGDPFLGSGGFSKYLGDLFERETSVRASTNKMRHAIVTHFMSLPESDNVKLRESLASLLKHSVRHQQQTYNDQCRQQKTEMGRKFMLKAISDSDHWDAESGEMAAIQSCSKQFSEGGTDDAELLPLVGEICALLDPASTGPMNAFIFVAKVVRYTPNKERVCLQEMEELSESSDLYRIKCSSTWWEKVNCLIYPIDIVYVPSENAYHLRTSAEQIYNDIKLRK